jgi:hypothetical protein
MPARTERTGPLSRSVATQKKNALGRVGASGDVSIAPKHSTLRWRGRKGTIFSQPKGLRPLISDGISSLDGPLKDNMTVQKPKRDAKTVFATAEQYLAANNVLLLAQQQQQGIRLEMPGVAVAAMTLELYLKCLAILEGKDPREDSHHLWRLFASLNGSTQNKIRQRATTRIEAAKPTFTNQYGDSVVVTDFDKLLKLSSNALKIARYPYEGVPPNMGWAASSILVAVREVIFEMRPAWVGAALAYPPGLGPPKIGPA